MKLRIGLATGPVSVGMIGMKIPKYCVFGETVNLATAMEERSQGILLILVIAVICQYLVVYPQGNFSPFSNQ